MTPEVARILAVSLLPLYTNKLITVLSGLVKTASVDQDGKKVRFPVPYDPDAMPFQIESTDLVPDSYQRGIIYFEGESAAIESGTANKTKMRSVLRLVCWYNSEKFELRQPGAMHSALFGEIMALLRQAKRVPTNLHALTLEMQDVQETTPRLFSKYTYTEERGQYLQPPYFAFGITISATYQINHCDEDRKLFPVDAVPEY